MTSKKSARKKLRYIAILDTETDSLEPPESVVVVEVAVILFDLEYAQPLRSFASLLRASSNAAESVNGIPAKMLRDAPQPESVWADVKSMVAQAQAVVAHNADFDRQFTPDFGVPWVCSENDIKWPHMARGKSLANLALSLGLGVASAHRAMADVDTLARIFTRLAEKGYDLVPILEHAMRPKAIFEAIVSYNDREIAKSFGFRWDPERKEWWRLLPIDDVRELPFKVRERPDSRR